MKSERKQIGECVYQVTQISASDGLEAAARMANLLGPGAAVAPDEGGFEMSSLGAVLGRVLSNPELAKQLKWFVQVFGARTEVMFADGKTQTLSKIYETHFAGEVANQFAWLYFAFEVNMSSFFDLARKLFAQLRAQAAKANSDSTFQNSADPSGQSGE